MRKKHIEKVTFSKLKEILHHTSYPNSDFYLDDSIAIINNGHYILNQVLHKGNPYEIEDGRIGLIKKGHATVIINLIEHQYAAGNLIYIGKGSIIQVQDASNDLEFVGIAIDWELLSFSFKGQVQYVFNGQLTDFIVHIDLAETEFVKSLIETALCLTKQDEYDKKTLYGLIAALFHYTDHLYSKAVGISRKRITHSQEIFNIFIQLINQHCRNERALAFYASKMCITQRYLGTIVKAVSGTTAKEWIDRAVTISAKVMLKHSDRQIRQISDNLNFSTSSFFCKFFKRMTGLTPQQYRCSDD